MEFQQFYNVIFVILPFSFLRKIGIISYYQKKYVDFTDVKTSRIDVSIRDLWCIRYVMSNKGLLKVENSLQKCSF